MRWCPCSSFGESLDICPVSNETDDIFPCPALRKCAESDVARDGVVRLRAPSGLLPRSIALLGKGIAEETSVNSTISCISFISIVKPTINHLRYDHPPAMKTTFARRSEPVLPSEEEREAALESSRLLSAHLKGREGLRFRLAEPGSRETVLLPPTALRLLVDILSQMAAGNAVTLIPINAELTTQQAADLLNVSRPFVVRLIGEGKLPARKIGTHRRVLYSDLKKFKEVIDHERTKALDELTKQAQELGLGY